MKRMFLMLRLLVPALLMITACDTALTVGSKTIGIRSGEFIYTDGYLRATYPFPLEKVWSACDKTLTDLKATDVEREKKIATGKSHGTDPGRQGPDLGRLRGKGDDGGLDHGRAVGQQPGIAAHPRPDRHTEIS